MGAGLSLEVRLGLDRENEFGIGTSEDFTQYKELLWKDFN
jgi:hypothetical protein